MLAGAGGTGGQTDSKSVTGSGVGGTGGSGGQSESRTVTGRTSVKLCCSNNTACVLTFHELLLQARIHMDWKILDSAGMLKLIQLRRDTMKASPWDLNSTVLLSLHARPLRNLHLPVHSAKRLTRGQSHLPHGVLLLLNFWAWWAEGRHLLCFCRAEEASYYRKEAEEAETRLTDAQTKLR